jgi:predicted nucleotide-binding protein
MRYLFVSYAGHDLEAVTPVVEALRREYRARALEVDVWMDVSHLRPGERWEGEITRALLASIGLLVFVSRSVVASAWVRKELEHAAGQRDRLLIPVIIERVPHLPAFLARQPQIDLSGGRTPDAVARAVSRIADITADHLRRSPAPPSPVSPAEAPKIASMVAAKARAAERAAREAKGTPDSVFVVHGHSEGMLRSVERYLATLGVRTVVLTKIGGPAQSLFQKFMQSSQQARFAIVLLSADDLGASRQQYEMPDVGDHALQFRGRQNVILELGFFYGRLGWENVFVLYERPDKGFPNFERPSDLDGIVFDTIDRGNRWREFLAQKLEDAGFKLKRARRTGSVKAIRSRSDAG